MIRQRFTTSPPQTPHRPGFLRDRRAAATAITAAVMTLMSVAGIALTADHTHLVYQRDTLKAATDAATLAATRHLWTLDKDLPDQKVDAALRPIARRYILANIPESRRERATETLEIELTTDSDAGTVAIVAQADLGGVIFGRWMYGDVVTSTRVDSLAELEIVYGSNPSTPDEQNIPDTPPMTELVLAIDITGSMSSDINGCDREPSCGESRMSIVKRAAQKLVDTITADATRTVAVGLVPWHFRVKFDQETRTRWEDLGWAQYPTRRYYPNPYWGSWTNIGRPLDGGNTGGWFPDPHLPTDAGEWHDLPSKPDAWQGCVDQRRMSGDNPPGISAVPPTVESFTMGFYSPTVGYPQRSPISYPCRQADPLPPKPNECFHNPSGFTEADDKIYFQQPQFNCYHSPIVPLTTDVAKIKREIHDLGAGGAATYSTLGAVWGHRLLAPDWRNIWGDAVHPVDVAPNVRKVLVLLTDGDDNHLEGDITRSHRSQACTAAKDAGIEIITVFAGNPNSGLKNELLRCASPSDPENPDEEGGNSFTGTTSEELEGAFEEIGRRLRPLRLR